MTTVEQKRRALAQADPQNADAQKAAQQDLIGALRSQLTALDAAGKAFIDDKQKVLEFATAAAQTASEIKDLNLAIEAGHKRTKVAGLEQHQANLEPLQQEAELQKIVAQGVEQHARALIALARTKAETTLAAGKDGSDDTIDGKLAKQKAAIEAERDDEIASARASLVAKQSTYNADLKAAGNSVAKKRELDAQWKNDQQATLDTIAEFNADANKQIVAATAAAAKQKADAASAAEQQGYDDALKAAVADAQRKEKLAEGSAKNLQALHQQTDAQTLNAMVTATLEENAVEIAAYNERIKNLDKFSNDYQKKYKELQDKIKQLEQQGDDQVTKLKQDALQKQVLDITSAENKMRDAIATDIAHSIVMNKSLAQAFRQTGAEMAEQAIKNLLVMEMTGDKQKLIEAKKAYHSAFAAMAGIPPAPMWGYAAGAAAFAGVMAFDTGGVIPGEGPVPIIGHGGEEVITKQLKERVERAEAWGGDQGASNHNWHFSPTVHAMDAEGVDRVLAKHNTVFQRHVASTLRRMNK